MLELLMLAETASGIGFVAVVMATVNVVGGFLVTDRMLEMFKSRTDRKRTAE